MSKSVKSSSLQTRQRRPEYSKKQPSTKKMSQAIAQFTKLFYLCHAKAQMAELVDALVSNTSGFTSMPVRSRLWVLKRRKLKNSLRFLFCIGN